MNTAEMTSEVIAEMNREREAAAKQAIRNAIAGIISQQEIIRSANTKIAEHKAALAAVTIVPVNAADIVG